jgi:hypothetical protein
MVPFYMLSQRELAPVEAKGVVFDSPVGAPFHDRPGNTPYAIKGRRI